MSMDIRDWEVRASDDGLFPDDPATLLRDDEKVPKVEKSNPLTILKNRAQKIRDNARPAPPRARSKPRIAVDRLIERGWEMLARLVAPVNLPVARVMNFQAPVAGLLLEDIVKNTAVDRMLQPLARGGERVEVGFALLGPPLIVALLQKRPDMAPVLIPALKESLRVWLEVAGPKIEIAREREAKFQREYGQAIDEMIAGIFAPVETENESTGSI